MKTLLALLLLIPSLSWGDSYLINLLKEIDTKIKTEDITSNQADFYIEQLSLATNIFEDTGLPCYKALVTSNNKNTYILNNDCLKFGSALGFESEENKKNIIKLMDITRYFIENVKNKKFNRSNENDNKKRTNLMNNMGKNISILREVISFNAKLK